MLDFDDNSKWGPQLTAAFGNLLSTQAVETLTAAKPEYIEDAYDLLFSCTDKQQIVDATLAWIRSMKVAGYHGSRLINSDVESIRTCGLLPLDANSRRSRLTRALSSHPEWDQAEACLDFALQHPGEGIMAKHREGQVHLTISRCGLICDFNQYLLFGSEFDQHVAQTLVGVGGKELLREDGQARVVRVAVPGEDALNAANPYFSVDYQLSCGNVPNLVDYVLQVWSYGLAYPEFDGGTLKVDCGMVFHEAVSPAWIVQIDTLTI